MPTKAKRLSSTALILILILPIFLTINVEPVEARLMDSVLSLREQPDLSILNAGANWSTDCVNIGEACVQGDTSVAGRGHMFQFIVFRTAWLDGMRLNTTTASVGCNSAFVGIMDGEFIRSRDSDWANDTDGLNLKGAGNLQTIRSGASWGGGGVGLNDSVVVDLSSATLSYVTFYFRCSDVSTIGTSDQLIGSVYLYNTTGSLVWFAEFPSGSVTMERTGSSKDYGYFPLENSPPNICVPESFEIMNPSALAEDGTPWVYTNSKFYWFNASYASFNLTGGDVASIRFSPDGDNNVTLSYTYLNDINGVILKSDSEGYVTTTSIARNGTGASYNSTTGDIWVIFPVYFTDNNPDAQYVDVYYACTGVDYLDSGEDFHIYNKGGLVEIEPPIGNGTITSAGEWFEGCVFEDGTIQFNQTWRKLQHFRSEYALRFYENVSGSWIPEDQFMQTQQHSGGGAEKYGGILDWILRWKIWGYDNSSSTWVRIIQVSMWMGDGDEGANDEWIAVATQVTDHNGVDEDTRYWNAFIEEEPAARFRTWLDLWVNKINASSVFGSRVNAYYFGMESGAWLIWSGWSPQLDNSTEVMSFLPMEFDDNSSAQARYWDLMKIELELDFADSGSSSDPYRVCIEDVNANEVQLSSTGEVLEGVNTPIFIAPKVPDMPIGGLLGGIYQAIMMLGEIIAGAASGALGLLWDAIGDRFPWFTGFFEGITAVIGDLATFFTTILGYLGQLWAWGVGLIGYLATPITVISDSYNSLVDNTAIFFAVNPSEVSLLLIMIVVFIPFLEAFQRGDSSYVIRSLSLMWGVTRTILDFAINLGGRVISWIIELIPF